MFCPNCGNKLPDGALFCANCGAKVQSDPAPASDPVYEAPVTEEPVTAQPYEEPVTEQPAYEAPVSAQPAGDVTAPADYMTVNIILLIVSVLSCCGCVSIASIVTSIIGIVSGNACKKAIAEGDWATAEAKSKTAKTMWIVSAVIVGVSIIAGLILVLTGAIAGVASEMNW